MALEILLNYCAFSLFEHLETSVFCYWIRN